MCLNHFHAISTLFQHTKCNQVLDCGSFLKENNILSVSAAFKYLPFLLLVSHPFSVSLKWHGVAEMSQELKVLHYAYFPGRLQTTNFSAICPHYRTASNCPP